MKYFYLILCLFITSFAFGQFTSVAIGNWNDGGTWGNASPGVSGVDYPAAGQNATIATNVTIPNSFAANANSVTINAISTSNLTIANGGSLTFTGILTTGSTLGSNGKLNVNGLLSVEQGATMANTTTSKFIVGSTGVYRHNYTTTAGVIYSATWTAGGTMEITGYTSNTATPTGGGTIPNGLNQNFQKFTWN